MIVVDSSALIAILDDEPERAQFARAIAAVDRPLISAATVVETGLVMMNRYGPGGARKATALLQECSFDIQSVTAHHAQLAMEAFAAYGRGQGHAARLNFGDCFSYALAKATGLPLLYKGDDFRQTDITSARMD